MPVKVATAPAPPRSRRTRAAARRIERLGLDPDHPPLIGGRKATSSLVADRPAPRRSSGHRARPAPRASSSAGRSRPSQRAQAIAVADVGRRRRSRARPSRRRREPPEQAGSSSAQPPVIDMCRATAGRRAARRCGNRGRAACARSRAAIAASRPASSAARGSPRAGRPRRPGRGRCTAAPVQVSRTRLQASQKCG